MATNIHNRLEALRARRDGSANQVTMGSSARMDNALSSLIAKAMRQPEAWEQRATADQPHTRWALGAMQSVGADYTRVSLETADRVIKQLIKAGLPAEYRLQGSVPLDVHIRGVSDVDLLALATELFTYRLDGAFAKRGGYQYPARRTNVDVLTELRQDIETALDNAFPAATVDKKGAKAVKISGGSLPRSVDVVPANWLDTVQYQETFNERDRGVEILNKNTLERIENRPFLHIDRIRSRCDQVSGGLRKAIRLSKNVKADSDRKILLPSFDIAAIMYHANLDALRLGSIFELSILAETQRHLDELACNHALARTLRVPDGSRLIFDTEEKLRGLNELSMEMDDLLSAVYAEHTPSYLSTQSMSDKRLAVSVLAA